MLVEDSIGRHTHPASRSIFGNKMSASVFSGRKICRSNVLSTQVKREATMKSKTTLISIFHLLIGCGLMTAFVGLCGNSGEYEFELEGVMSDEPAGHTAFTCNMHVAVCDCRWAIFQTWESPTNRIITELSDDGTNIYQLDHIEKPSVNNGWEPMPNSYVGNLYPTGFPLTVLDPENVILFYAYASSCYLDSVTNGLLAPIRLGPGPSMTGNARVPDNLFRNPSSPRLPGRICFLEIHDLGVQWTNAILSTFDSTNLGSIKIPSRVEFVSYRANPARIVTRYAFHATNFLNHCSLQSFTPVLAGRAVVEDNRFARGRVDVPPISYPQITNSQWPTIEQSMAQGE